MRSGSKRFAFLVACLAVAGPVYGQKPADAGPPDWLEQAKTVAQMEGISVGEAVRRAKLQQKFDREVERLSNSPDYAGSYISRSGNGYRVVHLFKGGKPAGETPSEPEVADATDYLPAAFSKSDIAKFRNTLRKLPLASTMRISTHTDLQRGKLVIAAESPAALKAALEAVGAIPEFVEFSGSPFYVETNASIAGAGAITGPTQALKSEPGKTGIPNCTAGFTVSNGSVRGISTAGHCSRDNLTLHRGAAMGTKQGAVVNTMGVDVSWYRNTANTYNNTIPYSGGFYTITSVVPLASTVGQSICLQKRDDTQVCAFVEFNDADLNVPDLNGNLILSGPFLQFDRSTGIPGDSGGPVFYGAKAFAIYGGRLCRDAAKTDCPKSYGTPASSFGQSGVGLSVVTN